MQHETVGAERWEGKVGDMTQSTTWLQRGSFPGFNALTSPRAALTDPGWPTGQGVPQQIGNVGGDPPGSSRVMSVAPTAGSCLWSSGEHFHSDAG
jgi:hypothetical protein